MKLAGLVIGRRKLAGAGLAGLGLLAFGLVVAFLGERWGLVLLAGLAVVVLLALGLVYVELRRQLRAAAAPAGLRELATRLAELERAGPDQPAAPDLLQLHSLIHQLADTVDGRLATMELAQQRAHSEVVWLRSEQRARWRGVDRVDRIEEIELIRSSDLFDASWYRARAELDEGDPVEHYVDRGASWGLDPHPLFASTWYLEQHPSALERWRTPLAHFLHESGRDRVGPHPDPHPTFWSDWYAARCPADAAPVLHFLREGARAGCDPNPLFHTRWYQQRYGHRFAAGTNPLVHYLVAGAAKDYDPSSLFDTAAARRRLGPAAGDPLSAFLVAERDPTTGLRAPRVGQDRDGKPVRADLRWEYLVRGLHHEPDTFILYRIIGNDLPPRHRAGQGIENLRFILEHEPELPGCRKRWVVNRIVDPAIEKQVIALLEARGIDYLHIPFEPAGYRQIGWRFRELEPPGLTYRPEFDQLSANDQQRVLDQVYHDKNRYVMNNNGARNAALREGRGLAKWVLPWDGNCFVTRPAWDELVEAVTSQPYLKYFVVPMARILDNQELLRAGLTVGPTEEPQLVFRRDAAEEFHPDARYGRRPKVELLWRLRIPGPWDSWTRLPWDLPRAEPSPEAGQFGEAGWVARLFSGEQQLEGDIVGRGWRRIEGVRALIDRLDQEHAAEPFDAAALFTLDDRWLASQRERFRAGEPGPGSVVAELVGRAEESLGRPTYQVTAKTTLPPSGDPHDYWHPAPYWWPNPKTRSGLPYIWRDGERVPGTLLWEPGSEQFDRSALQSMIDETLVTALAGSFTGEPKFFERGAALLRAWFLDPETRMNPHLRFAQVRRGHHGDEGTASGIIETNDFHYLLDAVRLIERAEALGPDEIRALRAWFGEFRVWLRDSPQGRGERAALNNHGTWYDVQVAAIDAYLGDLPGLLQTLRRSQERVGQQFEPDGRQPEELRRTQTQHYCAYNLQGWVVLAGFSRRVGQDLWSYRTPDGRSLAGAAAWVQQRAGAPWPYEQQDPFDDDRLVVLAHEADGAAEPTRREAWHIKQVFSPHDGIRPFWVLGGR